VSWDEAFSDIYDEWSAEMTADIPFYVALARETEGPLVELAVGDGRVAIPVARATGRAVIGIDTSPSMLRRAGLQATAAGVTLDLRLSDMRELALDEPAGLVYCPFRALLHLPTWTDRRRTFERVAASLRPGGRFAWNAFAFSHRVASGLDGVRRERPVPNTNRYHVGDNRVDIELDSGARSSLWWATKNEWLGLIDVAGLEVEALYGGFAREPFADDSGEYVFVVRRPAPSRSGEARARHLLERMVGAWDLTGEMGAVPLRQRVEARWALDNRYVEMRCTQVDAPSGDTPYEAVYYIGYEQASGRLVMHLLDSTGVAGERNVGSGVPETNAVTFTFRYSGGPFTNRFTHDPEHDRWTHELSATVAGSPSPFATKQLSRVLKG
jgi:SAM-dependent methyltransferase